MMKQAGDVTKAVTRTGGIGIRGCWRHPRRAGSSSAILERLVSAPGTVTSASRLITGPFMAMRPLIPNKVKFGGLKS